MVSYAGCVPQWQKENDHKVPEEVVAVQDDVMYQGTHLVAGTRSHLLDRFCDVIKPTFLVLLVSSVCCMGWQPHLKGNRIRIFRKENVIEKDRDGEPLVPVSIWYKV
jgi:hypothetical protein